MKTTTERVEILAREIRSAFPDSTIELYVYGSGAVSSGDPIDFDTLAILPANLSKFEFVKGIAPILYRLTVENKMLFSCFPLSQIEFDVPRSQFALNVKENGVRVCHLM